MVAAGYVNSARTSKSADGAVGKLSSWTTWTLAVTAWESKNSAPPQNAQSGWRGEIDRCRARGRERLPEVLCSNADEIDAKERSGD